MSTAVLQPPLVEDLYRTLEEKVRTLRPKDDLAALDRAYRYAVELCMGIRSANRASLTSRIRLRVALILADMQMDMVCLQTGLLHDVLEDTAVNGRRIREISLGKTWRAAWTASPN